MIQALAGKPAVLTQRHGPALVVTINRPEAANAVNSAVSIALADALTDAQDDDEVAGVVVTGAGTRAFCAGADLVAVSRGESVSDPSVAHFGFAGFVRHPIDKPTVAAVNGYALGGGMEVVLACDLAIAAQSASFGLPEVTVGLFAAGGGAIRLRDHVPPKVAMHMLFTGERLDAATALDFGLVNRVLPDPEVVRAAIAVVESIAANDLDAVRASKRVALGIENGRFRDETAAWQHNAEVRDSLRRRVGATERASAFAARSRERTGGGPRNQDGGKEQS